MSPPVLWNNLFTVITIMRNPPYALATMDSVEVYKASKPPASNRNHLEWRVCGFLSARVLSRLEGN
jgi:hypothetical protein